MEREEKAQKMMRIACVNKGFRLQDLSSFTTEKLHIACLTIIDDNPQLDYDDLFDAATTALGFLLMDSPRL